MSNLDEKKQPIDSRRDLVIGGTKDQTFEYCVEHFIQTAHRAIADHGFFAVAISGGSTPKGIYSLLASPLYKPRVPWEKVFLFWSDERAVPPGHPDSNYKMAMEAGISDLEIPAKNIFRMDGENDIEVNALVYEKQIRKVLPTGSFDLVMLGMGEDGHTASLFPHTHALQSTHRLAVANYVPKLHSWRMTLTFECINAATHIAIYVLGSDKAAMVKEIFSAPFEPDRLPIQMIGTSTHRALWVLDKEAASLLPTFI